MLERAGPGTGGRPRNGSGAAAALRDDSARCSPRVSPALDLEELLWDHPVRQLVTTDPVVRDLGGPPAGAVLRLVRVLPALRGRRDRTRTAARSGTARSRPRPSALPADRRHGLRRGLPAADPPDRPDQPQGPQQHARRPRPRTSARRGRSAPPRAATTRSTRSWARWTTSAVHRRGRTSSAWRSRWTWRCRRARPPVGARAPGVVHHPAGRHHRLRGEPAEEVPGHLPAQLRQRPQGLREEVLRVVLHWVAQGSRSSGWTTRTPSR